jgi:hypothetical protein
MTVTNFGTVNGKNVDSFVLTEFESTFERDWLPSETLTSRTPWGKMVDAFQGINVPFSQITALEQKAKSKNVGVETIVRSALERELIHA